MKVALIARSTLYDAPGGDTVQVKETARHLQRLGVDASICLTDQPVDYPAYQLFHLKVRKCGINLRGLRLIQQKLRS